jgi:hypothetical protein
MFCQREQDVCESTPSRRGRHTHGTVLTWHLPSRQDAARCVSIGANQRAVSTRFQPTRRTYREKLSRSSYRLDSCLPDVQELSCRVTSSKDKCPRNAATPLNRMNMNERHRMTPVVGRLYVNLTESIATCERVSYLSTLNGISSKYVTTIDSSMLYDVCRR